MNWKTALDINNGDYAYHDYGGMIDRKEDNTYTVTTGRMGGPERKGLSLADIPRALKALGMSEDEWSFE